MKHVQRRHFFVRDMVESFEIRVPYVPTNENIADFFTMPLTAKMIAFMKESDDYGFFAASFFIERMPIWAV